MVFSSVSFIFAFLPVTLIGYYLLRKTGARNIWLLAVSFLFYAWGGPTFLPIMLFSILMNYFGGVGFLLVRDTKGRRIWLVMIVSGNLALLGYWKYMTFILEELERLSRYEFHVDPITLPIGISFFTFQGMSYFIDCFRDTSLIQKNPLKVALYISMFPQLVAGPIVRYTEVRRQIDDRICTEENCAYGLRRFVAGLGKKAIMLWRLQ